LLAKRRQQIPNGVNDGDGVGSGLPLNSQRHHLLAVITGGQPVVLDAVNHIAEVA
jgi:hypothetical protein